MAAVFGCVHTFWDSLYDDGAVEWKDIYQQTKMIQGTQKFHCFIPITEIKIAAKLFSTDTEISYI